MAGTEHVSGYTATRKGRTYHVDAYTRSPGDMSPLDLLSEIRQLTEKPSAPASKPGGPPDRTGATKARTRLTTLRREVAERKRLGTWRDPAPEPTPAAPEPEPFKYASARDIERAEAKKDPFAEVKKLVNAIDKVANEKPTTKASPKKSTPLGGRTESDILKEIASLRDDPSSRTRRVGLQRELARRRKATDEPPTKNKRPAIPVGMREATPEDRRARAIPPAWTDVYVTDNENAPLQVRARDPKGRQKSIYSAAHDRAQAAKKFQRIKDLHEHIDSLDSALKKDAMEDDTAAALLLIRATGMRPGSTKNTKAEQQAYGATTLLTKHASVRNGEVTFSFVGKGGKSLTIKSDDPGLVRAVQKRLDDNDGDTPLFNTTAAKTLAYLKDNTTKQFLVKDLRTYKANAIALREIKTHEGTPDTKQQYRQWRNEVAKIVSEQLGNTPSMALSAYINPAVFDEWRKDPTWP